MTNITLAEIKDDKFLDNINQEVEETIEFFQTKEALFIFNKLSQALDDYGAKIDGEMYQTYSEIIHKAAIVAIPLLSDGTVEKIFRESLLIALSMDLDLIERLRTKLIGLPVEDRNPLKKKLSNALNVNKEVISKGKFKVVGGKDEIASISNWIRNYRGYTGGYYFDQIKNLEYFTNNEVFRIISARNQQKVKNIIELYRFLQRSSEEMEGYDESFIVNDNGVMKIFDNGVFEVLRKKISRKIDPIKEEADYADTPLESLKKKYNQYRRARWSILNLEDEILVATKGDIESIKKELSAAARQQQTDRVIASIKILARQDALVGAMQSSPAWLNALGEYLVAKYDSESNPDKLAAVVSQAKNNISSPAIISEFLQYLLKEKLKMSENDSALVATDIGQLLGNDYQAMSFGNQSTGSFEWTKNKIVDQRLVVDID